MKNLDPADLAVRLAVCRTIIRIFRNSVRGDIQSSGDLCYLDALEKIRGALNGVKHGVHGNTIREVAGELLLLDRFDAVEDEARHLLPEVFKSE